MNDRNTPDQLDQLLCQWAKEQTPSAADLDQMTARIVQSVDEAAGDQPSRGEPVLLARSPRSRMAPLAWIAVGAAAVLLLASGYVWLVDPAENENGPPMIARQNDLPPAYAWLQEGQLRQKAVLLKEMESIFDGKLNWLAETGDDVQVGLTTQSPMKDAPALAVRIVVQRRPVGQPDWTLAWAIDVVARSEEVVRLVSDSSQETQFAVWAYALPDGMIAVDTDLNLDQLGAARATTSELQPNGQPCEVLATEADGVEFRVFQTAALLNERVS